MIASLNFPILNRFLFFCVKAILGVISSAGVHSSTDLPYFFQEISPPFSITDFPPLPNSLFFMSNTFLFSQQVHRLGLTHFQNYIDIILVHLQSNLTLEKSCAVIAC